MPSGNITASDFYVASGTLGFNAPSYIERQADQKLFHGLLRGQFCYVLDARQTGKSSLMIHTMQRLREAGATVAALDLTALGQNSEAPEWYRGLLEQLAQRLNLQEQADAYWKAHLSLGLLQRWMVVLRRVILPHYLGTVVIFIDEIDMVRSLRRFSADEFLAGIRQCYNERAEHAEMERLSFCLLGVAAPTDLIRDSRMTPFNIGIRVELDDFTEPEALPLARGLAGGTESGKSLLHRILYWTGGHPYLTQRLCLELAHDPGARSTRVVDKACARLFLSAEAQACDDNLLFVRESLLHSEADLAALLELYSRIRRGKRVLADEANPLVNTIRLAGIVRTTNGYLRVRNRIYLRVFNQRWIRDSLPDAELRRQRAAYRRGLLRASVVAVLVLALVSWFAIEALRQRRRATEEAEASRRILYDRQMGLAQQEWDNGNVGRVDELLHATMPRPGQLDLRGFEWFQRWQDTHPNALFQKEEYPVIGLSVDRKRQFLVAAELLAWREKTNQLLLKEFDLASKREIHSFRVPYDTGFDLIAFTPDGRKAVVADPYSDAKGEPATATLWDLLSGRRLGTFRGGHTARLSALAISADGQQLATADTSGVIRLWSISSYMGKTLSRGQGHRPRWLAFSPRGTRLAVADETLQIELWDTHSYRKLPPIISRAGVLDAAIFFPDGQQVLTASKNGDLQMWQLSTRARIHVMTGHTGFTQCMSFSPDHKVIATGNYDRTVRIWSAVTGKLLRIIKGHGAAVNSLAWSPDGQYLLSGSADTTIKIWDMKAQEEPILPREKVTAYLATAFTAKDHLLALGVTSENKIKVWNLSTGEEISHLVDSGDHILTAVFSPDHKLVATGGTDKSIKLWNVATGGLFKECQGDMSYVYAVAFSPDGRFLVSGGKDQTLRLWDAYTCQLISMPKDDVESSWRAAFSSDGQYLASADRDGGVKLRGVPSLKAVRTLRGHTQKVTAIAFSPEGKWLVTGGDDGRVRLWNVATGQLIKELGLVDRMQRAVFSPDGKRLVTGGVEGTIKFWDMVTGQELLTWKQGFDEISSVTFSSDGLRLATSSMDGSMQLLRAAEDSLVSVTINQQTHK